MSTAFHALTNGQAEKANLIVEYSFHSYNANRQATWNKLLPRVEFTSNTTCHQLIHMSPFQVDMGYVRRMPLYSMAGGTTTVDRVQKETRTSFAMRRADIVIEFYQNLTNEQ